MIHPSLARALITSAVLMAGGLLAGCNSDEVSLAANAKANQPVPPKLVAEMSEKDMDLQSPILIRLFKQEAELEVWKQNRSGRFEILRTYPICRWSGDLGPKVREGDRQAPEGFYAITPAQMNPQSAYYLSFNTGYPNAYDKSLGHTGSQLMVHGDCSSRGCYAMTDEQIAEIYSLGRESFFGGQRAFQLQAYPFRMTALNMARHRNNPNMPFWRMIKEGYDHFEVTHQEPKVDFCEKKYVFDAAKPPNATRDPVFEASAKCPAYVVPDEIANAVREKQQQDEAEFAKLVAKGTPVARLNTGIDGGMNKVFASKLPEASTGLSDGGEGQSLSLLAMSRAPGTIPSHVNPPKPNLSTPDEPVVATSAPAHSTAAPSTRVAAASAGAQPEGWLSNLTRKMSMGGTADASATSTPAQSTAKPRSVEAKHNDAGPRVEKLAVASKPVESKAVESRPAEPRQVIGRPPLKPALTDKSAPATTAQAPSPGKDTLVAGAQPIVSSNSFESRFSAVK